jgi:hypothetical protein
MAPQITYYRTWCKSCNDWKPFKSSFINKESSVCTVCDIEFTDITLGEIPIEKVIEQRERYTKSIKLKRQKFSRGFLDLGSIFNSAVYPEMSGFYSHEVNEYDAGQIAIDEKLAIIEGEKKMKIYEERNRQREEVSTYRMINRNDNCLCGSNLKYKKCCLSRIESYK